MPGSARTGAGQGKALSPRLGGTAGVQAMLVKSGCLSGQICQRPFLHP